MISENKNKNKDDEEYIFIDTQEGLSETAKYLENEKVISVDLEADSLYHYKGKVCLIQLSTRSKNIVIDTVVLKDISLLKKIFNDPGITKLFHGADYDIRSLYGDFEIEVNALFDTQIAAKFLGRHEIGLADILRERLNVELKKKYQKKDWSKRPLPEAMLSYAVKDTCYLRAVTKMLKKELKEKGRYSWVLEECEILSRVRPNNNHTGPFFTGFKGASRMDSRSLAVLEEVLKLRDRIAEKRDLPHFKVLGNLQIQGIVQARPRSKKELGTIKGMTPKLIDSFGESLIRKVDRAMLIPESKLPRYPKRRGKSVSRSVSGRITALKEWRVREAAGLEIDPSLVCSNSQIKAIAISNPANTNQLGSIEVVRKWQKNVFGKKICSILKNEP